MNVFVLSTGRSGTTTFSRACAHIDNYTSGHETRMMTFPNRFNYPPDHIEIDNRLSWMLGRLDDIYGQKAFYVHLISDKKRTANSFFRRWGSVHSISQAYTQAILYQKRNKIEYCEDFHETVHANIRLFLKDKPQKMQIHLDRAKAKFPVFWQKIGAKGDIDAALAEWDIKHNSSEQEKKAKTTISKLKNWWKSNATKKQ